VMVSKPKIAIFSRMVFIVSLLCYGGRPRAFVGRHVRVIDRDERHCCAGAHPSTKEFSCSGEPTLRCAPHSFTTSSAMK
jgi:hypothetical protein